MPLRNTLPWRVARVATIRKGICNLEETLDAESWKGRNENFVSDDAKVESDWKNLPFFGGRRKSNVGAKLQYYGQRNRSKLLTYKDSTSHASFGKNSNCFCTPQPSSSRCLSGPILEDFLVLRLVGIAVPSLLLLDTVSSSSQRWRFNSNEFVQSTSSS